MHTKTPTYGPQHPGWDPVREQEQEREHAKLDAAVAGADAVTLESGDLTDPNWQELQVAKTALGPVPPLRHGPQHATWDPFREQTLVVEHQAIERTGAAAIVVAEIDGDPLETAWVTFEDTLKQLDPHVILFPP